MAEAAAAGGQLLVVALLVSLEEHMKKLRYAMGIVVIIRMALGNNRAKELPHRDGRGDEHKCVSAVAGSEDGHSGPQRHVAGPLGAPAVQRCSPQSNVPHQVKHQFGANEVKLSCRVDETVGEILEKPSAVNLNRLGIGPLVRPHRCNGGGGDEASDDAVAAVVAAVSARGNEVKGELSAGAQAMWGEAGAGGSARCGAAAGLLSVVVVDIAALRSARGGRAAVVVDRG